MTFDQITLLFSTSNIIDFFFKAFAIVFAFMYLFYGIVLTRQTQLLNRALVGYNATLFTLISSLQILFGLILVYLAIFTL